VGPSQFTDEPIPIVGIFNISVIFLAVDVLIHSRTIAKTPEFCNKIASLINIRFSYSVLPFDLNFPLTV
jgi:hypothetical protein